ncbi:MAG: hypothetical protein QOD90_2115 [Mycobacterium sp.]|nr:hypothetical protein [Mycobacterium sp.]
MPPDGLLGNGTGAGGSTGVGELTTGLGIAIGAAGTVTTTTRETPGRSRSGAVGAAATTGEGTAAGEIVVGAEAGVGANEVEDEGATAGTSVVANWWMARFPTTASALAASTAASPLTIHPDFVGARGSRTACRRTVGSPRSGLAS